MADHSLNFSSFVNQQIELQETIRSYLAKAQALIQVAIDSDSFGTFSHKIIHNYLWALSEVVDIACERNENSLGILQDQLNNSCDAA